MKHEGAVSLALFLGSMTLMAQSSRRNTTQPAVASVARASMNCPVDMQAQRQIGPGTTALTATRQQGPVQTLRLILNNPKFAEIVDLHITVYGLNSKGRISPAQTAAKSSEITKSIDLKLKVDPKSQTAIDLVLPKFTSVSVVDLDSVHYADGSTWLPSADQTCHVFPDGEMLISSR